MKTKGKRKPSKLTPYIEGELEKENPENLGAVSIDGNEYLLHHGDSRRLQLIKPEKNEAMIIAEAKVTAAATGQYVESAKRGADGILTIQFRKLPESRP